MRANVVSPEVDSGSKGEWIYGNYIEWSNLEDLDQEFIDNLCEECGVGASLAIDEKIELLREKDIPEGTAYEGDSYNFPLRVGYWCEQDEYT